MAKKSSFFSTLRYILSLIAPTIRLRAFLDWFKNPSYLAHKTILE